MDTLVEMLNVGMTAARVDLTWGPPEYHVQWLKNLKEAMQRTKRLCATIVDTVGREVLVRTEYELDKDGWPVHTSTTSITQGQEVRLTADPNAKLSSSCLPITFPFEHIAHAGDTFFVGRYLASGADDSSVWLEVTRIEGRDVVCEAKNSSELSGLLTILHAEHPDRGGGLNYTDLPLLSEHDEAALRYIAERVPDLDLVSLTFTRSGADVEEARAFLHNDLGLEHVKILAKLEDAAALAEFDSITAMADGIILSRGNLGLDVAPEKMARVQKSIISACNLLGLPIVMTRILDTMVVSPRPTRAEATDVANAVLDGADAFMLGAETLRGRFPVATVSTVSAIAREAELVFDHEAVYDNLIGIASQADADGEGHRKGLYMGTPDDSQGSLHPEVSSPMVADGELGEAQLPTLHHGLPSTVSVGRLRKLTNQSQQSASSHTLTKLAWEEARRTHRLESVASTGVRAATKIGARLIITYSHSGRTASLVAKYRPSMPVIALMVPRLIQKGMKWQLYGLSAARQLQIVRGVIPLLGAPMAGASDRLLRQAVEAAAARGLVGPNDHVVCILSQKDDLVVQALSVDSLGNGFDTGPRADEQAALLAAPGPPGASDSARTEGSSGDKGTGGGKPALGSLRMPSRSVSRSISLAGRNGDGGGVTPSALSYDSPMHVSPSEAGEGGDGTGGDSEAVGGTVGA